MLKKEDFFRLNKTITFPAPKNVYFSRDLTLEEGSLGQIEYIFEYSAPGWALCRFEDNLKRPIWLEVELKNLISVTNKRETKNQKMASPVKNAVNHS